MQHNFFNSLQIQIFLELDFYEKSYLRMASHD